MSEGRDDTRDILIEVRADLRHVRQTVENFRQSEDKQWKKMDDLGREIGGHEKSISFLTKGFWIAISAIATGVVGVVVFYVNHRPP